MQSPSHGTAQPQWLAGAAEVVQPVLRHRKHPALPNASAVSFTPYNIAECFQLPVSLQSSKSLCLQISTAPSSSRAGAACCCQHCICTFRISALEEGQDSLKSGEFSHIKLGTTASDSACIPTSQHWSREQSLLHPLLPQNAGCRSRAAGVVVKQHGREELRAVTRMAFPPAWAEKERKNTYFHSDVQTKISQI